MNSKRLILILLFCMLINEINTVECDNTTKTECLNSGVPGKEASCWVSVKYEKDKKDKEDCTCIKGIKGKLGDNQLEQFKSIFTSDTWGLDDKEKDENVNVKCNPASFYGLGFIMLIAYFILIL